MLKRYFLFLIPISIFFLYLIFSSKNITNSFYHWENSYKIENSRKKLYIKILDIEFSNKLELIKTKFLKKPSKNFVPVIYITNKAMKKSSLLELINKISKHLDSSKLSFSELQIDCDWSLSTKAKYFKFLEEIKKRFPVNLSATIRLHQIKYANKTGVPPVDYGLLMYYNMSNIASFDTKNSILDNEIAKKYHFNFDKYPLRLKLALPLYSQAIQFRYKKAISIFEGVKKRDLSLENFTEIKENFYKAKKSFFL